METEFLDLKELKNKSSLYENTFKWLKTLTMEKDSEDGSEFVKFVEKNLTREKPFTTFILVNKNQVVGVVSIVPDDQDAGKELDLEGIWIAGVNIKREYRGKGYGKILMKYVESYLESISKEKPLKVNLFVRNPIALHIYEKIGFENIGLKVHRQNKENEVCSKMYN